MTSEASRPSQKRKDEAMPQKPSVPLAPKKRKPRQAPAVPSTDMARSAEPRVSGDPYAVELREVEGEKLNDTVAKAMLGPGIRHGHIVAVFAGKMLNGTGESVGMMEAAAVIEQRAAEAMAGDLSFASATLASQAVTCDLMFSEFARRAAEQVGTNIDVADRYARLALKAQSNCRTTLEALAKLHQPREQTVRHININAGGQAVVADEFHHHQAGGLEIERTSQCHASDDRAAGTRPSLPSPDALRNAVPVASRTGKASLPHARGK